MSWSSYTYYKASGVEWLGGVPSHWQVHRLKWSVESSQNGIWGEEADGGPNDIRCVRVADFDRPALRIHDRDITYRKVTPQERRGRLLVSGDLILEKSGGGEKNPVGFVVLYDRDDPAITSNFLARVSLQSAMEPRYWTYMHSSLYRSRLTQPSIKQTSGIQNLDQQSYFDERVCFPPFEEQQVIADWLDTETAKIDALIAKQEQLIATLREDRTATITHAVTNGIDPNVETQDSGVEWLGSVPAHWRQTQLRHLLCRIEQGVSPQAYADLADEGWGVLKSGCVNGGFFADTQHKKLPADFEIDPAIVVKEGDLLVCRASGSTSFVGSTAIVRRLRYQLILSDKTFRLVPGSLVLPDYLEWAMNSRMYREQVGGAISGAEGLANNLPMSALRTFRFPVPPLDEQEQICRYLNLRCQAIDALIVNADELIDVMREYRSALITDAVTGKIDVRGAA